MLTTIWKAILAIHFSFAASAKTTPTSIFSSWNALAVYDNSGISATNLQDWNNLVTFAGAAGAARLEEAATFEAFYDAYDQVLDQFVVTQSFTQENSVICTNKPAQLQHVLASVLLQSTSRDQVIASGLVNLLANETVNESITTILESLQKHAKCLYIIETPLTLPDGTTLDPEMTDCLSDRSVEFQLLTQDDDGFLSVERIRLFMVGTVSSDDTPQKWTVRKLEQRVGVLNTPIFEQASSTITTRLADRPDLLVQATLAATVNVSSTDDDDITASLPKLDSNHCGTPSGGHSGDKPAEVSGSTCLSTVLSVMAMVGCMLFAL